MSKNKLNITLIKRFLLFLFAVGILFLPIALYVNEFGTSLSSAHSRWSEFGAIMSGIYSPLIAFIALVILVIQSLIQRSMNKHQHDQAFISSAREDVNFYIDKLDTYLSQAYEDGKTIKEHITLNYRNLDNAAFLNQEVVRRIQAFYAHHQLVVDIWMALYPVLKGLEAGKNYPYDHVFSSSVLRISSCLSLATCVAIDNMYHVITNDCQHGKYYYK